MEPAFVQRDTEVRIVAKFVLSTHTVTIVHKSASARTALLVHPRMDGATVQQDGLVYLVIAPATTNHMARTARVNAIALTMLRAIRKMAHAHVLLVSPADFARIIAKKDSLGSDVLRSVIATMTIAYTVILLRVVASASQIGEESVARPSVQKVFMVQTVIHNANA